MLGTCIVWVREVARYKLDLVSIQEARRHKRGTERAEELYFFYRKGNDYHQLGTGNFVQHRIAPALHRVKVLVRVCHI
jgi:hypothetical protein